MSKPRSKLIDYSRTFRQVRGFTTELHFGKQAKHIPGSTTFIPGRSIVELSILDIQTLIERTAGTGVWIGDNKERIDTNFRIGLWFKKEGGTPVPTNAFLIHYSKAGTHIVPAVPKEKI